MEEKIAEALVDLVKQYGPLSVLTMFLVWKHYLEPKHKKAKGVYVSYKDLSDQIENSNMRVSRLQNQFDYHMQKYQEFLEEEARENIMMAEMKKDIQSGKEKHAETREDVKAVFGYISDIKDSFSALQARMIAMGYGNK